VKEKPAEAQHPTTHPQSETVQTLPAASNAAKPTSLVAAPKTTSPTNSPSNLPATVQPNIASIPAKSSTYQSSSRRPQPKKQPSAPKVPSVSMKSSTGNMQSGNVPIIQAKTATPGSKFVHYKVKQGETLFSIQRKHQGSSVQEIINMNNLRDNGNKIYPNQVLKIRVK
jgi:LysM repeat protein